mmetsp:Transcript_1981/g.5008  ORF Transcript_1981/g.5008 Transcript_1981/m.5008 type:complete len:309 (+) Transcript_1981:87-1013(+)
MQASTGIVPTTTVVPIGMITPTMHMPISKITQWQPAPKDSPFSLQVPTLELASHLRLADMAALAVTSPAVAVAFRAAARVTHGKPASGLEPHSEVMDLVCCILAAATCGGEVSLCSMQCADGKTVLTMAAMAGRPDVVRWLLDSTSGAGLADKPDACGASALHYAALAGHDHVCEVLLAGGASPDIADATGVRPLHLAAENGHLGACRALLDGGANANVRDERNETPLLLAVESKRSEVCCMLVRRKADPLASSVHGRTPLAAARELGDDEVTRALEAALWPLVRKKCSPIIQGPRAIEVMQRALRMR